MTDLQESNFSFKPTGIDKSKLTWAKKTMSNNLTTTVTVSPTTTTELRWLLPSNVMNLSESTFDFDFTVPAQGAGNHSTFVQGCSMIDSIALQTTNGVKIVELSEVNRVCSVLVAPNTSHDELLTKDKTSLLYPSNEKLQL
jgi:hypothetical protein